MTQKFETTKRIAEAIEQAFTLTCEEGGDGVVMAQRMFEELDSAWTVDASCAHSLITTTEDGRQHVAMANPPGERNGFVVVQINEIHTRSPDGYGPDQLISSTIRTREATDAEVDYIEEGIKRGNQDVTNQRNALFR